MNSTVMALVIYILLMYVLMCMYNKIELLNAAVISMTVFITVFMGLAYLLGVNKALALLLILLVSVAAFMLFWGRRPGHSLNRKQNIIKVLLRALLFAVLTFAVQKVLVYAQAESQDALSYASADFNRYVWCIIWITVIVAIVVDFIIHAIGYTRAQKLGAKLYPVGAVAVIAAGALVIVLKAAVLGSTAVVTALTVLFAVFIAGIGLAGLYKNKDIIELTFLAVSEFVLGYILSAGILIAFNRFSIQMALGLAVILLVLADIIIYAVRRQKPQIKFLWKKGLFGLIISAAVIPLGFSTFGFFGMGQDEGVYQAKAIGYIYGYNDNYVSFNEYNGLASDEEKSRYMQVLGNELAGYNFALSEEKVSAGKDISRNDTLGNLHGIHTFSALLGLYGTVFGVENMLGLGSVILMLSVFLIWLILGNLKTGSLYKGIAVLLYLTSPQILWQARTSLVETTLAFIILAFIYLITDEKNKNLRWLSWIPVAVFSYFHITIYVFMPLFVLIEYGLYFTTGKRRYMGAAALSIMAYFSGFYMMYTSSLTYVYGNYDRLYIGQVGTGNINKFVTAVSAGALLLTLMLTALPIKKRAKSVAKNKKLEIFRGILAIILAAAGTAGCIYVAGQSSYPFSYITSYAYMMSSGIVMIPVIILAALIRPKVFGKNSSVVILSAMFYYCVVLYSIAFKREVLHYYYYGRYIVPYLSVIVILGACVMQNIYGELSSCKRNRNKNIMSGICSLAAMLAAALLSPYAAVVTTQQDQTELQWEVVTDITEMIKADTAVVVCGDAASKCMMMFKYMTEADIYVDMQDLQEQLHNLSGRYDKIYVVSMNEDDKRFAEHMDKIYHNDNVIQTDVKMPEKLSGIKALIPYAEEFETFSMPISVYEYLSES